MENLCFSWIFARSKSSFMMFQKAQCRLSICFSSSLFSSCLSSFSLGAEAHLPPLVSSCCSVVMACLQNCSVCCRTSWYRSLLGSWIWARILATSSSVPGAMHLTVFWTSLLCPKWEKGSFLAGLLSAVFEILYIQFFIFVVGGCLE